MATRFKSVIALLAAVTVVITPACAGDPPVPTPNIEATVEVRVAHERAVDATVEVRVAQERVAHERAVDATVEARVKELGATQPTQTPVAIVNKVVPTDTPVPKNTSAPENTPVPTAAPTTPLPLPTATPKSTATPVPTATPNPPAHTPTITPGVPESSASAITSPPASAEGINTQTEVYGTSADPNIITLGPKIGGPLGGAPYPNKTSMEFELNLSTPVLAPIDMVLVGFDNRNAEYRTYPDGQQDAPFNDLEICFESESPDWPGMIVCTYHLSTSPLLLGHNQNVSCGEVEEWQGTIQAVGHLFFEFDDYVSPGIGEFGSCDALTGRSVKRGAPIGFAGSVGTHSMAPFRFKVSHTSENPTVQKGNRYLHWVQPGSFFYWKCYSPGTKFPSGVLAYPFECGGYQLPAERHDVNFQYSSKK